MLQLATGVTVCSVPTENISQAWPIVQPQVARALAQGLGEYDLVDVWTALLRGDAQLWLATGEDKAIIGVAVTEVVDYPRRKLCNLWIIAGTGLEQWKEGLQHIESWAVSRGCSGLLATCRPGLVKVAMRQGFRVERQLVFKPLLQNLS